MAARKSGIGMALFKSPAVRRLMARGGRTGSRSGSKPRSSQLGGFAGLGARLAIPAAARMVIRKRGGARGSQSSRFGLPGVRSGEFRGKAKEGQKQMQRKRSILRELGVEMRGR